SASGLRREQALIQQSLQQDAAHFPGAQKSYFLPRQIISHNFPSSYVSQHLHRGDTEARRKAPSFFSVSPCLRGESSLLRSHASAASHPIPGCRHHVVEAARGLPLEQSLRPGRV